MKKIYLLALCFLSIGALAQTDTANKQTRSMILSGAAAKLVVGGAVANLTDRNVYDSEGNVLDSVAALKLLRTYDYRFGLGRVKGQEGLRQTISKIDPAGEEMMLKAILAGKKPVSPKLQVGEVLDLSPFGKRIDPATLNGKALVLIFWCDGCYPNPRKTGYDNINYITGKFANPEKFEVFSITHLPAENALSALKKSPILNAHQFFNAQGLTIGYETDNKSLIVITDKDHKITYAKGGWAVTTDRFLYKSLEAL